MSNEIMQEIKALRSEVRETRESQIRMEEQLKPIPGRVQAVEVTAQRHEVLIKEHDKSIGRLWKGVGAIVVGAIAKFFGG